MPNKCSASGCRSNYAGESYTPVFKLPTCPPDLVNQWLRALSREGIEDLKNIYACAKHFHHEDIEINFSMPQLDGSVLEIQRTIPKLRKNAIPRVLPNCPSYLSLSSHSKPQRLDRSARDDKLFFIAVEQSLGEFRLEEEQYKVTTLQELESKRKPFDLPKQWTSWSTDATSLHFIKPCIMNNIIFIARSLTITDTLHTTHLHPPIFQALFFIAGYAVHDVYYKHSRKCTTCLSLLTEIKDMEFEEPSDSKYKLIQIIDRGSLKWPYC